MEATKIGRSLGFVEHLFSFQNSTVLTIAHTKGHVYNQEDIKTAIKATIDFHPLLRVNLNISTSPREWKQVTNPYIEPQFLNAGSEDDWKKVANDIINNRFKYGEDSPLFRFTLIQYEDNGYLMVQQDHANGDGVSGAILVNSIMDYYVKASNGEEINVISQDLLGSPEKFCYPDGISEEENLKIDETKKSIEELRKVRERLLDLKMNPNPDHKNYALFHSGSQENMKEVKAMCKKYGVTFGAFVHRSYSF